MFMLQPNVESVGVHDTCDSVCFSMHRTGYYWPRSYRYDHHVRCLSDAQEGRGKLRA